MKKVLLGKVILLEQEGGHASPIIKIGEEYIENIILKFPQHQMDEGPFINDIVLDGEYKITIEENNL